MKAFRWAGLIAKQQRFCEEYLLDLNATQAAIRSGYSERSASELGYQLLQNPSVQAEISAQIAERSARTAINQDRVVEELAYVAFSDLGGMLFDAKGRLMPIQAAPEGLRRAISRLRVVEDGKGGLITEVRLWDKVRALELLGRHLGMFGTVADHRTARGLTAAIQAGRRRARLHRCA